MSITEVARAIKLSLKALVEIALGPAPKPRVPTHREISGSLRYQYVPVPAQIPRNEQRRMIDAGEFPSAEMILATRTGIRRELEQRIAEEAAQHDLEVLAHRSVGAWQPKLKAAVAARG